MWNKIFSRKFLPVLSDRVRTLVDAVTYCSRLQMVPRRVCPTRFANEIVVVRVDINTEKIRSRYFRHVHVVDKDRDQ